MSAPGRRPPILRVVVAVDASPLSQAAANTACALAARLAVPVEAVFVEDINVVRLVAHPYVHTISLAAARRQSADDTLIGKALELQLVAARRGLAAALDATGAHGAFSVRRGRVEAELLAVQRPGDLICLGWSGRSAPGARPRLGSVARAVTGQAAGAVMLSQGGGDGPLCLWWDGDMAALDFAAGLAVGRDAALHLLVPARDRAEGENRAAQALAGLDRHGIRAQVRAVGRPSRLLASLGGDCLLILSAGAGMALDGVPCSMMVVR